MDDVREPQEEDADVIAHAAASVAKERQAEAGIIVVSPCDDGSYDVSVLWNSPRTREVVEAMTGGGAAPATPTFTTRKVAEA